MTRTGASCRQCEQLQLLGVGLAGDDAHFGAHHPEAQQVLQDRVQGIARRLVPGDAMRDRRQPGAGQRERTPVQRVDALQVHRLLAAGPQELADVRRRTRRAEREQIRLRCVALRDQRVVEPPERFQLVLHDGTRHERSLALLGHRKPFAREAGDGLAHGHARHAEALHQLAFGGQPVECLEPHAGDVLCQAVGDLHVQCHAALAIEFHRARGSIRR